MWCRSRRQQPLPNTHPVPGPGSASGLRCTTLAPGNDIVAWWGVCVGGKESTRPLSYFTWGFPPQSPDAAGSCLPSRDPGSPLSSLTATPCSRSFISYLDNGCETPLASPQPLALPLSSLHQAFRGSSSFTTAPLRWPEIRLLP